MPRDFELSIQRVYQAVLRPGDIAVDVGAHVGRHAFPMAAAVAGATSTGRPGKVHAFEPLPQIREQMTRALAEEHPELRETVEIYDYALSNFSGSAEYTVAVNLLAYSGLRERIYDHPTELQKITVPVRTLDELFLPKLLSPFFRPPIRYIKVDAEGGEYHIFQGARRCLQWFRPLVSFEFGANTLKHYGITCRDMGDFWFGLNYRLYDVNGRHLETPEIFARSAEDQQVWDYVAVPAENGDLEQAVREALKEPAVS